MVEGTSSIERDIAEYQRRKRREWWREYYRTHKAELIARKKEYVQTHRAERRAYMKKWRDANKDKCSAHRQAYNEKRKAERAKQKSEEVIPCKTADQRRHSASSNS